MFPDDFLTSSQNRLLIFLTLTGLVLVGLGIIYFKSGLNFSGTKVEILQDNVSTESARMLTVEIAGSVQKAGVYKLPADARINDLILLSGGFSGDADRSWTDKYLNKAAKLIDGQKIYIPSIDEQTLGTSANSGGLDQNTSSQIKSDSNSLININSASLSELDSLPGIGQVYGQSIIDNRPYSKVEELQTRNVLRPSTYEKIKDLISVY